MLPTSGYPLFVPVCFIPSILKVVAGGGVYFSLHSFFDMTSSQLVKWHLNVGDLVRPEFLLYVRLLVDRCSALIVYFSHAANHFGMATFIFLTLRPVLGKWVWLVYLWAVIIGYAQVYVGVHYPFDVVGGATIGIAFGWLLGTFFNKRFGFVNFE